MGFKYNESFKTFCQLWPSFKGETLSSKTCTLKPFIIRPPDNDPVGRPGLNSIAGVYLLGLGRE